MRNKKNPPSLACRLRWRPRLSPPLGPNNGSRSCTSRCAWVPRASAWEPRTALRFIGVTVTDRLKILAGAGLATQKNRGHSIIAGAADMTTMQALSGNLPSECCAAPVPMVTDHG